MPYQRTGAEVKKGDVVRWRQGRDELQGEIVRLARDGSWCDVRYYTGPGSIFPEIDHRDAPRLDLAAVLGAQGGAGSMMAPAREGAASGAGEPPTVGGDGTSRARAQR